MIGRIAGIVDYVAEDHVLIDVSGVGYIVHCGRGTLARLPQAGEPAALYTEMVVREDLMQLIGFATVAEREWLRLLTSVQGVGAKVAVGIIDALGPDGVSRALALGDAAAMRAAPGVGPKLAARIVNELVDKAPGVMALGSRAERRGTGPAARPATAAVFDPGGAGTDGAADALSALVNLGYDRGEAARAVAEAGRDGEAGTEALIRAALRALAPDAGG